MDASWSELVKARAASMHALSSQRTDRAITHANAGVVLGLVAALVYTPVWPLALALFVLTGSWLYRTSLAHQTLQAVLLDEDTADHIATVGVRVEDIYKELVKHQNAFAAMSNRLGSVTGVGLQPTEARGSGFNRLGKGR